MTAVVSTVSCIVFNATQAPQNRDYRVELARVLSWAGRSAESIVEYREVLKMSPGDTEARMGLAQVLSWDRRLDEALACYDRALAPLSGQQICAGGLRGATELAPEIEFPGQ